MSGASKSVALGCVVVLLLSAPPGLLQSLAYPAFVAIAGLMCFAAFVSPLIYWLMRGKWHLLQTRSPSLRITATKLMIAATLVLLVLAVPRRIAFALSRPAFERVVATAPQEGVVPIRDSWVGLFHVKEVEVDPRGGVYFYVTDRPDGLGPDRLISGFAFRPNGKGSPFGSAGYATRSLLDEWSTFTTSNDW